MNAWRAQMARSGSQVFIIRLFDSKARLILKLSESGQELKIHFDLFLGFSAFSACNYELTDTVRRSSYLRNYVLRSWRTWANLEKEYGRAGVGGKPRFHPS